MDLADVFTSPVVPMNDPQRADTLPPPFEVGEESIHSPLLNEIQGRGLSQLNVPFKPLPDNVCWVFTPPPQ